MSWYPTSYPTLAGFHRRAPLTTKSAARSPQIAHRSRAAQSLDRILPGPASQMSEERVERRLPAIPAGDIADYSRLMGVDEEGTLDRIKVLRRELVDPKVKEHRGRIVKT